MENITFANELSAITRCLMSSSANIFSVCDELTKEELGNALKELKKTTKDIYVIIQKGLVGFNFEQYYNFLLNNPMAF